MCLAALLSLFSVVRSMICCFLLLYWRSLDHEHDAQGMTLGQSLLTAMSKVRRIFGGFIRA